MDLDQQGVNMLEFLLATLITFSAGVREPRQIPNAPFDYELSYKIENEYKGLDLSFRHDYEREDGQLFNDIRGELNYKKGLIVIKEDYKQIASKDLYQFNSDVRINIKGFSAGYGVIWNLEDEVLFASSVGYSKKLESGKWKFETENDVYLTKPISYQIESSVLYKVSEQVGIGISGNYIEAISGMDYSAKMILTLKLK